MTAFSDSTNPSALPCVPNHGEITMSAMSRRRLVAGTAALPALAVPALAANDPILAAIERHRAARTGRLKLLDHYGNQDPPEDIGGAAWNGESDALRALLTTTPTTLAGAVALMRYIADCQPPDEENLGCGVIFWEEDENKAIGVMVRIADCIAKHVA
jgi:hypothetical protein